jgi:hypothetical protein
MRAFPSLQITRYSLLVTHYSLQNMPYSHLTTSLYNQGFQRIERDDRLLDIMPNQTREKGIELWEKTIRDQVTIIRLRLPYSLQKTKTYTIPLPVLEAALANNTQLNLELHQSDSR